VAGGFELAGHERDGGWFATERLAEPRLDHRAVPGEFEQQRLLPRMETDGGEERGGPGGAGDLERMRDDHIQQVLRTGTTDGVTMKGVPTVLMRYRGVKTGEVRMTPVMRVEHQGRYAVVASNGGGPRNPTWYASLVAEPLVELQDGAVTRRYRSQDVSGDDKALWWRRAVDVFPDFADYQRMTDRVIPVFVLEPVWEE
jgi:deazaflavin-dependent oxidoreductase (nitroreductase family)